MLSSFMRIKILLALFFVTLLAPVYVSAASGTIEPDFNPMCWKLDQCNNARAFFLNKTPEELKGNKDGWLENIDPCNKPEWGRCLPGGITKTTIAFGGKRSFTDIGDFLKYNYNFALGIAGILATIMIVIAGIQWVTSGGNSEMISSAKKRIGGALIGLLIAYLSYTILNIVNPALVNLRLPQVYMIRPINTTPQFCRDLESPTSTQFAKASDKGQVVDKSTFPSATLKDMDVKDMACGDNYFVGGAAGNTCMGGTCSTKGQICLPVSIMSNSEILTPGQINKYLPSCSESQVIFHFSIENSLETFIREKVPVYANVGAVDWLDQNGWLEFNPFLLWPVCHHEGVDQDYIGAKYKKFDPVFQKVEKSPFYEYYVSFKGVTTTSEWGCAGGKDEVKGFVFKFEMDKNWSLYDPNFYVSKSHIGDWKSISNNGYISKADMDNGIYVDVMLSYEAMNELTDKTGTEPTVGINSVNGIKNLDGVESK